MIRLADNTLSYNVLPVATLMCYSTLPGPYAGSGRGEKQANAHISHNVLCRFNAVNFHPNPHKRHPIARLWGRAMGCLLWISTLMHILPQSLSNHMQNHIMLDRAITALDRIIKFYFVRILLPFTAVYKPLLSSSIIFFPCVSPWTTFCGKFSDLICSI